MWSGDQSLAVLTFIWVKLLQKKIFFERCSWFKFNNLELALVMTLKFDTNVEK